MTLIIARFVGCLGQIEQHKPCLDHPTDLLSLIGLVVESMLFGMFTICMMIDQWGVVSTNVTHIDRLKGETFQGDDVVSGFSEVFGSAGDYSSKSKRDGFRIDWLSPFVKVCFPEDLRDEILGYCQPCSRYARAKSKLDDDYDIEALVGSNSGRRSFPKIAQVI